jgi:hypothetical protein
MAIWRTADHSGLGGFTGGTDTSSPLGQGDVRSGVNVINAGDPSAMSQGGGSPMDMQGFFGMLMQLLRRYQGGSMQPGQFPPQAGQMPQQTGAQAYTPQNPSDWQQYSQRQAPPRPSRPQFPTSGPEAGGALGNVFSTDMFGGGGMEPYQAPPTQGGTGLVLSR